MTRPPAAAMVVTLALGKEVCALEVAMVREILDSGPITRLPEAPPFLVGVIDLRGETVPVIDLRVKLGMTAAPVTPETRIVVVELGRRDRSLAVGLQVERVFEVAQLEPGGLKPPPDIGGGWRPAGIKAIGRLRDDFVIVLDLPKLFSAGEIDAIPAPP
jgi:purine-binding chemotaxis protein CheW